MAIDYERAFKTLKEQIDMEYKWAMDYSEESGFPHNEIHNAYNRGSLFAYRSIKELSDKLSDGSFVFDGQYDYMLTEK